MRQLWLLVVILCCALHNPARAAVVQFQTLPGATGGGMPVSAQATFTTSTNQIQIVLENLQANPTSVIQCISGLQFHVTTGQNSGTIASSSGTDRTVNSNDTYTDGSTGSTGWGLQTQGSNLVLNALGFIGPEHLIIGPPGPSSLYTNANGSIAGNGPHNPFIGLSATFVLNVPGVTSSSSIDSAVFRFNTSAGTNVTGSMSEVPEPSLALLATPLALLGRRRSTRA